MDILCGRIACWSTEIGRQIELEGATRRSGTEEPFEVMKWVNHGSRTLASTSSYLLLDKKSGEIWRRSCESLITAKIGNHRNRRRRLSGGHKKKFRRIRAPARRSIFRSSSKVTRTHRTQQNPKPTENFFGQIRPKHPRPEFTEPFRNRTAEFFRTFRNFERNCKQTVSETVCRAS